jgi:hypothetical protein
LVEQLLGDDRRVLAVVARVSVSDDSAVGLVAKDLLHALAAKPAAPRERLDARARGEVLEHRAHGVCVCVEAQESPSRLAGRVVPEGRLSEGPEALAGDGRDPGGRVVAEVARVAVVLLGVHGEADEASEIEAVLAPLRREQARTGVLELPEDRERVPDALTGQPARRVDEDGRSLACPRAFHHRLEARARLPAERGRAALFLEQLQRVA